MQLRPFVLPVLFFFVLSSCEKKEQEVTTHIHDATMKVNVYHQVQKPSGGYDNIPIKDATVELYETSYDREISQNLILSLHTDSSGLAQFYGLKKDYYYLRASHPTYGEQLDETATPDGSLSFVEFVY